MTVMDGMVRCQRADQLMAMIHPLLRLLPLIAALSNMPAVAQATQQ